MIRRMIVVTGAIIAAILIAGGLPSSAQVPTPIPSLSPTLPAIPSPSDEPEPEPSQSADPDPSGSPSPGDRSSPPRGKGGPSESPGSAGKAPESSADAPAGFPLKVPFVDRTPSQTSARLAEILAPLTQRGVELEEAFLMAAPPFPVMGLVWYADDWLLPRLGPPPHLHEGTDIFADAGTPVVASGPGTIEVTGDATLGGTSLWIVGDDGTCFFYAHLSAYADNVAPGVRVDTGTVVGYLGNTGNAITTPPHLHLEIHPPYQDSKGKIIKPGLTVTPTGVGDCNAPAVNPKPYLDKWLLLAEQRAEGLVVDQLQEMSKIGRELFLRERAGQLYSGVPIGDDQTWMSAFQPSLTSIGLAREQVRVSTLFNPPGSLAQRQRAQQLSSKVRLLMELPRLKLEQLFGGLLGADQDPSAEAIF